jgi:hypothetical protein
LPAVVSSKLTFAPWLIVILCSHSRHEAGGSFARYSSSISGAVGRVAAVAQ